MVTTGASATTDIGAPRELAPFARLPVLAIAGATSLLLLLNSGRGGYFADEVYFVAAGGRPFGYADQPPLVPLLAHALHSAFPDSLVALRLPMVLLAGAGCVLTALIARELGGDRRAQWLAAAAYPLSPVFLGMARILGTYSIDPVLWTLAIWLLVRWVRLRQEGRRADRLLLLFGLTVAVDVQVKYLIGGFLVVLAVALLAVGPRRLLTRPMLWLGAAITVVTMVPGIVWQARNGWPQLEMAQVLSAGGKIIWQPAWFVPAVVVGAGIPGAFLLCYGLWRLLRSPELRPYRFLGWAVVGTTVLFVVTAGGFYYAMGLVPLCWAVGAVELRRRPVARWWRWVPTVPACAVMAVLAVVSTAMAPSPTLGLSGGWQDVVAVAGKTYDELPAGERERTTVMAHMYYQAAALEVFGPRHGLPPRVYSSNRGYWYFGAPPARTDRVLYVGGSAVELEKWFAHVDRVATAPGTPAGSVGQNKDVPVFTCSSPRRPLPMMWPRMQRAFA
ncbi:MAG: phospholipid carrier-dependent glycosyltransferase [Streptosporangiales bacterium]|nr:phospholipid carrier-dependent glycosyltransferase [Streptosporangiales bacterium]